MVPQPPAQRLPAITRTGFSLIRFRSPLLSESLLFSLPVGTEMFHFPTFPPHTLYIQARVTGHDSSWVSPFDTPDHSLVANSQGLSQAPTSFIALDAKASTMCPSYSLSHTHNTTTIATKMLASTMQISNNKPTNHHPHTLQRTAGRRRPQATSQPADPSGPNSVPTHPGSPPPRSTPTHPRKGTDGQY